MRHCPPRKVTGPARPTHAHLRGPFDRRAEQTPPQRATRCMCEGKSYWADVVHSRPASTGTQETDGCIPLTRKHTHEHSDNVIAPLARVLWVALPLSKLSTAWEEDPGPAFTSSKSAKNSTTGD